HSAHSTPTLHSFPTRRSSDLDDLTVLSAMRAVSPATQIILMTAYGSKELSLEARKRGAFAMLNKPFDISVLAPLVARAIEMSKGDRKSTRLNSSHLGISYAVF